MVGGGKEMSRCRARARSQREDEQHASGRQAGATWAGAEVELVRHLCASGSRAEFRSRQGPGETLRQCGILASSAGHASPEPRI